MPRLPGKSYLRLAFGRAGRRRREAELAGKGKDTLTRGSLVERSNLIKGEVKKNVKSLNPLSSKKEKKTSRVSDARRRKKGGGSLL